jgi:taurine dioxygenase
VTQDTLVASLRRDLSERGWHVGQLAAESSPDALLTICNALGTPVAPTGGRLVEKVTPMNGASYLTLTRQSVPPHTDGLFLPSTPAIVALHAVRVPESGGETVLIDGGHALGNLPAAVRDTLAGGDVEITAAGFTATKRLIGDGPFGPVLMFLDPRVGGAITVRHRGHPLDDALLDAVGTACRAARTVLVHRWRVGDLLVFDNRAFLHARGSFRGERELRRVLVA